MIYLKDNPVGLDAAIQRKQTFLYDMLKARWNVPDDKFLSYGRCYRNQTKEGYAPEMYVGKKEYKDLYFDDKKSVLSFFGCEIREIEKSIRTADVHIIFMVNLKDVKPSILYRADEEAMEDVYGLIRDEQPVFEITRQITGIGNVFKEYDGFKTAKSIKFVDMQNFFCFRFNATMIYQPDFCKFNLNP